MADLDSLDYKSILNMSDDEGIEHLRQIRLSRRTTIRKPKIGSKPKQKQEDKKIDTNLAAEILKILEGK
jgi:hypothetical protein